MVYKEQYDMLIKEYCDIYDDETRQYLLSIDEAAYNKFGQNARKMAFDLSWECQEKVLLKSYSEL